MARQLRRPGGGDGRPGGHRPPGGNFTHADFVNITCSGPIDYSCDPTGNATEGVFVCRTKETRFGEIARPKCIATNRALDGDQCGCCGGDCPVPCNSCDCTTGSGDPGFEVDIDGDIECLHPRAAMEEVFRNDLAECNTVCST